MSSKGEWFTRESSSSSLAKCNTAISAPRSGQGRSRLCGWEEETREQKSRDRFLASRSDLIKDAVRTARQTDPGEGRRSRWRERRRGGFRKEGTGPFTLAQSRPTICGFHVFSTLLRSPPLRYVTGGLVPLWWPERHSRPPRPNIIVIYRALSRIPHNKGRLDYLLPRLKLPLPLPFFPARALSRARIVFGETRLCH